MEILKMKYRNRSFSLRKRIPRRDQDLTTKGNVR